jgi:hypothetical protein
MAYRMKSIQRTRLITDRITQVPPASFRIGSWTAFIKILLKDTAMDFMGAGVLMPVYAASFKYPDATTGTGVHVISDLCSQVQTSIYQFIELCLYFARGTHDGYTSVIVLIL